jgi:hypothetical protein
MFAKCQHLAGKVGLGHARFPLLTKRRLWENHDCDQPRAGLAHKDDRLLVIPIHWEPVAAGLSHPPGGSAAARPGHPGAPARPHCGSDATAGLWVIPSDKLDAQALYRKPPTTSGPSMEQPLTLSLIPTTSI